MKLPRPRLSVRTMIGLVAACALLVWGWMAYFDPVRLWKEAIRDKYDQERRHEAIHRAIGGQVRGLSPDLALDELIALIADPNAHLMIRSTAVDTLDQFGPERARRAIPALIAAMGDGSPSIRLGAALEIRQVLGTHPEDGPLERQAIAGLVDRLDDPDRRVRRWSACCLGWMGHGDVAVPTLARALAEPNLDYQGKKQILTALGGAGPKAAGALPAVLELAKTDSVDEGNVGGENGRRGNADVLIAASRFLHAFGQADRAVAILRKLAADRDPRIAREARGVLDSPSFGRAVAGSEAKP